MQNLLTQLKAAKEEYSNLVAALNVFASKDENDAVCDAIDKSLANVERLERTVAVREEAHKLRLRIAA